MVKHRFDEFERIHFRRVELKLENIERKVDALLSIHASRTPLKPAPIASLLLALPQKYQKTIITMMKQPPGEYRAYTISRITGRARAVESMYMNDLSRIIPLPGYGPLLNKRWEGHKTFFSLSSEIDASSMPEDVKIHRGRASGKPIQEL